MGEFQGVAETLFIPLTARVYVSKRFPEYFHDPKALALEPVIPETSIEERSSEYAMIASVARYHNLDEMVQTFIDAHSTCNIVNLGCGLETACFRIGTAGGGTMFYEVDLPEVIEIRRCMLGAAENEVLIAGDLFDLRWAKGVDGSVPTLMVASGVFQYFHAADVLGFIRNAQERFPDAELIFDATNSTGLRYANRYVRKTGNTAATMHFSIDDASAFASEAGVQLIEQRPFYTAARKILANKVNLYTRIAMAVTDKARRAFLVHVRL